MGSALDQTLVLCDMAAEVVAGTSLAAEVAAVRQRATGPLRVAIAGRVKAGKSTLLNALVGERLAPTDAGECTRLVTWYQAGGGYEVEAVLVDGGREPLAFRRVDGALVVDVGGVGPDLERIHHLEVSWPSAALRDVTLIDTPGLASLDDRNSLRTREFLALDDDDRPSDADAVIYLMRHLHRADAEFLGAFLDRSVAASSPVNAVAVLARADEIGAGRLDAMDSARRIAARYQADPTLRTLCTHVTPMAGLLAESGQTWREEEAAALRTLAATTDAAVLQRMLLGVDEFCEPGNSDLTVELRRELLDRLGLFGVRLVLASLAAGGAATAADQSRLFVATSGVDDLRALLAQRFLPRAQTLKARSALAALRAIARKLGVIDAVRGRSLDAAIERAESGIGDFGRLRTAHLVLSGAVSLTSDEASEVERATAPDSTDRDRLELPADASGDDCRAAAISAIGRWRTRGGDPRNDAAATEVCDTVARIFEEIYAGAAGPS